MIFQLKRKQLLKSDINTVWDFVSSPSNLSKITPSYMLFEITSTMRAFPLYHLVISIASEHKFLHVQC